MSDEIRPEDEVEAHGVVADADAVLDGSTAAAADDQEPDVEAHGNVMNAPTQAIPLEGGTVQ